MFEVLNTPGGHILILLLGAAAGLGMRMSGDPMGAEVFEHACTLLLLRMGLPSAADVKRKLIEPPKE